MYVHISRCFYANREAWTKKPTNIKGKHTKRAYVCPARTCTHTYLYNFFKLLIIFFFYKTWQLPYMQMLANQCDVIDTKKRLQTIRAGEYLLHKYTLTHTELYKVPIWLTNTNTHTHTLYFTLKGDVDGILAQFALLTRHCALFLVGCEQKKKSKKIIQWKIDCRNSEWGAYAYEAYEALQASGNVKYTWALCFNEKLQVRLGLHVNTFIWKI